MDFYYRKASSSFLKSLAESSSIHGLDNIQNYIPIYTNFLNINEKNYNTIGLNSKYEPVSVVLPLPKDPEHCDGDDDLDYNPHFIDLEVVDSSKPNSQSEFKSVFVKYSPLLDPIRFLSGKYNTVDHSKLMLLPKYKEENEKQDELNMPMQKVLDVNNSAYVDGFFTYLSSKVLQHHKFIHGLEYYGAFIGHKRQFEVDISDDVEFFSTCPFFNSNLGKLFTMDEYSFEQMSLQTGLGKGNTSDRAYKPKLHIDDINKQEDVFEIQFDKFDDSGLKTIFTDTPLVPYEVESASIENVYKRTSEKLSGGNSNCDRFDSNSNTIFDQCNSSSRSFSSHDSKSSNTSTRSNLNNCDIDTDDADPDTSNNDTENNDTDNKTNGNNEENGTNQFDHVHANDHDDNDEDDDDDDDTDEDSQDDDGVYVEIEKFPVNAIFMEECEETLDSLMEGDDPISNDEWASILMQVIMTLIAYQKMFWFTHNDLHTNNIMYNETKKEYIYYTYGGKHYKVPTYGKIFKIIDFGRSVYKFKNIVMCSDSFHSSGDAATQYNFPPYMNPDKPLLEPNFSFDLCRLACSMFDYFIPTYDSKNKVDLKSERVTSLIATNPIIGLINEWVTDDKGRNVLYKSSGKERYPDFKLYKMIARTVHKHIPSAQLNNPLFSKYEVKRSTLSSSAKQQFMNIDEYPEY
jgi:hypothetical protein